MSGVLTVFVAAAAVSWLSVFGYVAILRLLAARAGREPAGEPAAWPAVTILVPILNEEELIGPKLADLRRTDYPPDRLRIVVADGGSNDRSVEIVERALAAGEPLRLLRVSAAGGKAAQVERALEQLDDEIVVVTDADAVLDPACVRELVRTLVDDPRTAVVGATVRPATALVEERVHWWLLNRLWWLEGEVLSAAMFSGVCYAVRRAVVDVRGQGAADDARLSVVAATRGLRVRLCVRAQATEVRVPSSAAELLDFRRRRGREYVRALSERRPASGALGWRLANAVRLWHLKVSPAMGIVLAGLGIALLGSAHWRWPLVASAAFAVPGLAAVARAAAAETDGTAWWRVAVAALRLTALTWVALLTLGRRRPAGLQRLAPAAAPPSRRHAA